MPYICHMLKLPDMHQWGKYANIYMPHTNSLASTMGPGMLYTDDNDTAALLHVMSWPLAKSAKKYYVMVVSL